MDYLGAPLGLVAPQVQEPQEVLGDLQRHYSCQADPVLQGVLGVLGPLLHRPNLFHSSE